MWVSYGTTSQTLAVKHAFIVIFGETDVKRVYVLVTSLNLGPSEHAQWISVCCMWVEKEPVFTSELGLP